MAVVAGGGGSVLEDPEAVGGLVAAVMPPKLY